MVYMGGKSKTADSICPIINKYIKENNIENFYDIFCGGANVSTHIVCDNIYATDLSPTLIALLNAAQSDFDGLLGNLPSTREQWDRCYVEYKELQAVNFHFTERMPQIPLYEIGSIEWFASFSGRGFPGGYGVKSTGRNLFEERKANLKKQSTTGSFQKIIFGVSDYRDLKIKKPNSLIYADAPYRGTKKYGINNKNNVFDYEEYYNWLREMAKAFPIFISEETMPDDFIEVWHKPVKRSLDANNDTRKIATEKLFFIDRRSDV